MKRFLNGILALAVVTAVLGQQTLTADEKPQLKEVKAKSITLKVPADWKEKPPSNRLRVAEFDIPLAEGDSFVEFYIAAFGGGGGGVKANVDRWIGQFQADGREVKVYKGNSEQGPYVLVDIKGTFNRSIGPPIQMKTMPVEEARMLALIVTVPDEGNYFLKLSGGQKTLDGLHDDIRTSIGADLATEKETELADE